ncbi:KAT8 regulatory NSL complex subunit 1 [Fopius arisanus]|uniref:KAT8 regulatory NSL complex subunit 1 n=1 Tax=Fopius arisanus TaxID=64838 RepID=A0A9R1T7C8_9HYME|nr:PREDICTED: KAT8 regulatory NSL complex subunit 1 [Fopius arisanus]XP_011304271.1 PREDICTED: KAT8 regulatory NSL complex subunit 1 [Fopius arisanus]XP_011304272.1 PREDICTED: KAT8 regulatory NSL complex subunit 1 [Fopius arisanus]XP_011304273.1 PREDICTED: KAT8 regulatory NSL complex subunit 1 [Fopius arisanus]XP_011304275.1 PREDICTED: KAT8 regulatory NSL complex subunit 1 [Fopius arisanus]XP_011304276.1 PREDICTED: KAT8 regulatory NSL complex subunit 1 [Fopius arisanus]XP_011304277.1 PREDICTE
MGVSRAPEQHRRGCRCSWEPLDVEAVSPSTSVAVMAPALTEGGPQKPNNILPLPSGGFLSPDKAAQVCNNRAVLAKFVVTANVQPTKIDEQCLRGISKDLIRDVINSKYENGIDCLSKCVLDASDDLIPTDFSKDIDILRVEEDNYDKRHVDLDVVKRPGHKDSKVSEVSDAIMSEPSAGEQNDEMGFIKTDVAPMVAPIINADDKDIEGSIMDISADIEDNVGDISQNVDDILDVIQEIEDEQIGGGGNEGSGTFNMSQGFSSLPDLLNDVDVDVMGLVSDNIGINLGHLNIAEAEESVEAQREQLLGNKHEGVQHRSFEQDRRTAFLMRRLRKLQARTIGRHIAEESTGVLELAHHSVKKYFMQELQSIGATKGAPRSLPQIPEDLNAFIRSLEKSCAAQSNTVTAQGNRQKNYCRYFGAGSRDIGVPGGSGSRHSPFTSAHVKLNSEQVENVAGSLATQLHTVETHLDSDCTASSSGGESCDEMQNYNNLHQQQLSISKRAGWKYAQERAGIASRWTWLQAQISDLEYKIRQHNELQRQMRLSKGLAYLDNAETVNGYSGVLPGSTSRHSTSESEGSPSTSRTRPFLWDVYRKRKLLRLEGLHEYSKRAARPSTVRCECDGSLASCAICTGRRDSMQPQEPFELLSVPERIALVDPSYHPVLSFPEDVTHSTHFEAIMKTIDWQQKIIRANARSARAKDKDSSDRRSKAKLPEHRTKYTTTTRIKKASSALLSARIKRKMLKGKRELGGQGKGLGIRKRAPKVSHPDDDDDISAQSSSSKHSSPVPSPSQHPTATTEKGPTKERNSNSQHRPRRNSYDIDNIVIPYSVAASARLEKLQYKEILTPKWRICGDLTKTDVKNGVMHRPSQDSDFEDMSEETIMLRHERSEREESKRFKSLLNKLPNNRFRHNRRADSRADSGANTPDPMSPHASDFGGDVTPITSPPATPSGTLETEHHAMMDHRNSTLQSTVRRRTNSSSMRVTKEDAASSIHEDENEVLPYEPRIFPLPEELYDKMLEAMPAGHWQNTPPALAPPEEKIDEEVELDPSESDTTESAYCDADGEDPNDPEWTEADDRDAEKERIRSTAKR